MIHETLAGLRPLLASEDMEVQERAHNATALLHVVLRRLAPADPALADAEPAADPAADQLATLVQHEHRSDSLLLLFCFIYSCCCYGSLICFKSFI